MRRRPLAAVPVTASVALNVNGAPVTGARPATALPPTTLGQPRHLRRGQRALRHGHHHCCPPLTRTSRVFQRLDDRLAHRRDHVNKSAADGRGEPPAVRRRVEAHAFASSISALCRWDRILPIVCPGAQISRQPVICRGVQLFRDVFLQFDMDVEGRAPRSDRRQSNIRMFSPVSYFDKLLKDGKGAAGNPPDSPSAFPLIPSG